MSGKPGTQEKVGRGRPPFRLWLETLRRGRSSGAFGIAEIAGLAGAAVILLAVTCAYFFLLIPANTNLTNLQTERARLQKQLSSSEADVTHTMDTQAAVEKISDSLDRFENDQLTGLSQGRTALYSELDGMIRRNGLRNTGGIAYVPLESLGSVIAPENGAASNPQTEGSKTMAGNAKWQSVYPGVGVRMTISGQYQNIRHFLRDIETSRKFLVINSLNLEGVTETMAARGLAAGLSPVAPPSTAGRGNTPGQPGGVAEAVGPPSSGRTGLVSLSIDMAAYFQR